MPGLVGGTDFETGGGATSVGEAVLVCGILCVVLPYSVDGDVLSEEAVVGDVDFVGCVPSPLCIELSLGAGG